MRSRTVLIAGLIALAASLIGMVIDSGMTRSTWDHMSGTGHMGWRGSRGTTTEAIEGAADVTVTATEFDFTPDELTATTGEPFNLILVNTGDVLHDLVIPDLGVRVVAGPSQEATTGIEVDQAGSYRILCSLPGHAGAGMTGLLTVTSDS